MDATVVVVHEPDAQVLLQAGVVEGRDGVELGQHGLLGAFDFAVEVSLAGLAGA